MCPQVRKPVAWTIGFDLAGDSAFIPEARAKSAPLRDSAPLRERYSVTCVTSARSSVYLLYYLLMYSVYLRYYARCTQFTCVAICFTSEDVHTLTRASLRHVNQVN